MEMNDLFRYLADRKGSDIHIKAGSAPCLRVDGELQPMNVSPLEPHDTERMAFSIMTDHHKSIFAEAKEVDLAYSLPGVGRFRANIFKEKGTVGLVIRMVRGDQLSLEELNLPEVVKSLAEEPRGLVLVTGTAGSGKTTTLSAMINHINHTKRRHIITIEDPIEVIHTDKQSFINQREIGIDTDSYADALKHVVRQDPDVIMIGEMRDAETTQAALSAAEIGNLVISSLHTIDATETINRIIDFFPPHQQKQVRVMLASTLRGIISLRLLPKIGGGRIPAVEVMVATSTIREYIINENETAKINEAIEQGEYYGMQSFDQSMLDLVTEELVSLEDAIAVSTNAHDFKLKAKKAGLRVA